MRSINRAWRDEAKQWPGGSILEALKIRKSESEVSLALTKSRQGEQPFKAVDEVLWNATRFALKNGEHTWGKDVKSNLKDNSNWTNPDFHKVCYLEYVNLVYIYLEYLYPTNRRLM